LLSGDLPAMRWYVPAAPALVLGLAQRTRGAELVDLERCRQAGVEVLERRAGGGVVLLDESVVCCTIGLRLPNPLIDDDLTESYRWVGDAFAAALRQLGVAGTRRVEVAEARQDVASLRQRSDVVGRYLLAACYGALSPHEVVVDGAKVVGLAQIRRRHAALYQIGVLLANQSRVADLLRVHDVAEREQLRAAIGDRSAGVQVDPGQLAAEVSPALAAVAADAAAADASSFGSRSD
jgi:lipoate---protein ligase